MDSRDFQGAELGDTVVCECCDSRGSIVKLTDTEVVVEFSGGPYYRTSRKYPTGIRLGSASYRVEPLTKA